MMNLAQTKLVGLTMELDLKAKEYKVLCDKLEQLKKSNIDPNDEKLLYMMQLFQKNHDEIVKINGEIKKIKDIENSQEHIYTNDIFKEKKSITDIAVIEKKETIFMKIKRIIYKIFHK